MIVVTIREDGALEAQADVGEDLHIVLIDKRERYTDSPVIEPATDDEMTEWIAEHRNAGYEDRNP